MNVQELKEKLNEFMDHYPVVLVLEEDDSYHDSLNKRIVTKFIVEMFNGVQGNEIRIQEIK